MINFQDSILCFTLVARMTGVCLLVGTLESITQYRQLQDEGLLSWKVGRLRQWWLVSGLIGSLLDFALRYPQVIFLLVFRGTLALVLVIGSREYLTSVYILLPLVLCNGLTILRNPYGQDGADQMAWIVITSLLIVSAAKEPNGHKVFLWFVALQSSLAYCAAGIAKLSARGWRDGTFLTAIMGTQIYGHPGFAAFLKQHPMFSRCASWILIVWECSFPLTLVFPKEYGVLILALGVCFHAGNCYLMGLNTFFWAFVGTYPAILFCSHSRAW
jgi:hypothetical protein